MGTILCTGFERDLNHMHDCTSCWLNAKYWDLQSASIHSEGAKIGDQTILLVDDEYVERLFSVFDRELQHPQVRNNGEPIIVGDQPWEFPKEGDITMDTATKQGHRVNTSRASVSFYGSVFFEAGVWSLFYMCPHSFTVLFANSTDGVKWNKPPLQLDGSNRLSLPATGAFSIYDDANEHNMSRRFKMVLANNMSMATLAYSHDQMTWHPCNDYKAVTGRAADTYNTLTWLPGAQQYLLVTRTDFSTRDGWREVRGIRFETSPSLDDPSSTFTPVTEWYLDREGKQERCRRQLYGLTHTYYAGLYIGLAIVLEYPRVLSEDFNNKTGRPELNFEVRHEYDVLNVYLTTSRNGIDWDLSWLYKGIGYKSFMIKEWH